ncbi:MAG: ribose-phosphate pyrophosphokinase [Alphaproteobacteria bacterium]|nr:ribose-phosphate pyrophosphokinase [Alphaproteobacteria bacterium]
MKLIAGSSHHHLAEKVADKLLFPLDKPNVKYFKDCEISVQIDTSVAGEDVYILQSLSYPINDHLVELLILINNLKQKNAKRVTAILPYFGYGRSSSSSALVVKLLESAGVDQIITIGLHSPEIETFFKIPIKNLGVTQLFGRDIKNRYKSKLPIIVSPDKGGEKRARALADFLQTDCAFLHKERLIDDSIKITKVIGDIRGRGCIIVDDIVDSAATLVCAAAALKEAGATFIEAYVIHAVLSKGSIQKLEQSDVSFLTITDTINQQLSEETRILEVAEILAEAINSK